MLGFPKPLQKVDIHPLFDNDNATSSEYNLIRAAQDDPAAFEALYHRYVQRVYQYAYVRLGQKEEAADATQQIFLQVWRSLVRYQPHHPFATWLFSIARHVVIDLQRRQRSTIAWQDVPEDAHPLDTQHNPEVVLFHNELKARIQHLVQHLAPDKRELLALYSDGYLTIAEIAVIVGKRPEAVRKQLTRLLKALREHYHATDR